MGHTFRHVLNLDDKEMKHLCCLRNVTTLLHFDCGQNSALVKGSHPKYRIQAVFWNQDFNTTTWIFVIP